MARKGARGFSTRKGNKEWKGSYGLVSELLLFLLQHAACTWYHKHGICLRFQLLDVSPLCGLGNSHNLLVHLLNKKQEEVISKQIHRFSSPRAGENKSLIRQQPE